MADSRVLFLLLILVQHVGTTQPQPCSKSVCMFPFLDVTIFKLEAKLAACACHLKTKITAPATGMETTTNSIKTAVLVLM